MLHGFFWLNAGLLFLHFPYALEFPSCPQLSPLHTTVPAAVTCLVNAAREPHQHLQRFHSLNCKLTVPRVGMEQEGHSLLPSTGLRAQHTRLQKDT